MMDKDLNKDEIMDLKPNQVVIVDKFPKGYENSYPFFEGQSLLYLGEISNMPGHCIVVDKKGRVYWGYHTENFRNPTEDEL